MTGSQQTHCTAGGMGALPSFRAPGRVTSTTLRVHIVPRPLRVSSTSSCFTSTTRMPSRAAADDEGDVLLLLLLLLLFLLATSAKARRHQPPGPTSKVLTPICQGARAHSASTGKIAEKADGKDHHHAATQGA